MTKKELLTTVITISKYMWKFLSTSLFEISGNKVSILSLVMAFFFFYLSSKLAKAAKKYVVKFLKDTELDIGIRDSIEKMTGYIVQVIGILITLHTIGINLNSLAALSAVLMVGIGFGLQNIAQNFISGLIILFERPIKIGDLVTVDGVSGKVVEIGARSTLIHTRDDTAIIVPNSKFISDQVINDSFSGEKRRVRVSVGVSYGSDVELVRQSLLKVAKEHSGVLSDPSPGVFFKNFGDSSLEFDLTVWLTEMWENEKILSDLRFAIDKSFRENKITIPFPQRDIHIKTQVSSHS